jgi:hypothetical protein
MYFLSYAIGYSTTRLALNKLFFETLAPQGSQKIICPNADYVLVENVRNARSTKDVRDV